MKKVHYRNIGFPKTGTNWLWVQLMRHPQVDCKLESNYKEYRGNSYESYKKIYEKYDVSVNLDTHAFARVFPAGHYIMPDRLHEHTTHVSMVLRSPYEVMNSMYNLERNRNANYKVDPKEYIEQYYTTYADMNQIFEYWSQCKLPVKYLFYDDLVADPKEYFYNICDYLGLNRYYKDIGIKFKTDINNPLVFDNEDIIKYINEGISVIEQTLNRDLSHWKHK